MRMKKTRAYIFYYIVRPVLNRFTKEGSFMKCPLCDDYIQKYGDVGFVHLSSGDADCFEALGKGKGSFK